MIRPVVTWVEPQPVDVPQSLLDFIGEPRLISELLVRRGMTTPELARSFIYPQHYLPSPASEMPDVSRAAERILQAIQAHERIGVWGDFDMDGQTSTTLLFETLTSLGADVIYHIPVRARETHGVNIPNLEKMLAQGVKLVLTCDTGITAHEAVEYVNHRGLTFIITDHHTLPPELPAAYAVINPQRLEPGHPLRTLPGVGTAYVLAQELFSQADRPGEADRYLDLVALGTVADVALLIGDARYHVQRGLQQLRETHRLGLQVLYETAEIVPAQISEEQISFAIAPRLNAIGRLDDANPIVDFFTTSDETTARLIATKLEGLNAQRKLLCDQVFRGALAQIQSDPGLLNHPVLILSHPEWPAGVVGIVASRLVDLFQRPAILLVAPPNQPARGSARSIEGINITAAITENASLLNGFGGHPMAAGLSLASENIADFRRAISRTVLRMVLDNPPLLDLNIDAFVDFQDLSLEFVEKLDQLSPFGAGNPRIVLATRNLSLKEYSEIGKTREHLQLLVEDEDGNTRRLLWWQGAGSPLPKGHFDLAYSAHASNFRGQVSVSLEWVGFREIADALPVVERPSLEVIDHRAELDSHPLLQSLLAADSPQIWREGENPQQVPGVSRYQIQPSATLIIWNPPPGLKELRAVLQSAAPRQLILFAVPSASDDPAAFLTRLLGLANYSIRHRAGWLTIAELAAACNQREAAIHKGLAWLVARGAICHLRVQDDKIQFAAGGILNQSAADQLEQEIKLILQETAAFRAYYLRSDPLQWL